MSNKNEPAYPLHPSVSSEATHRNGLTKREYFAGLAMQGFLSNSFVMESLNREVENADELKIRLIRSTLAYTNALLEALNEGGES